MRTVRMTLFFIVLVHLIAITGFGQVFPVFPNGTLPDGSFYRSTLTIANPSAFDTSCTVRLQPDAQPSSVTSFTVNKNSWMVWHAYLFNVTNAYTPSYLVVSCDQPTSVEARYALYSSASVMVGEATVLPLSGLMYAAFVLDHESNQTRTGLAITNDSEVTLPITITVYDTTNSNPPITRSITMAPRTTLTKFIDELTGWQGSLGLVTVSASYQFFATGLRFTGPVFSTLPPILSQ